MLGPAVEGVDHRVRLKGPRRLADADDDRPVVVHLDLGGGLDELAEPLDVGLVGFLGLLERLIEVAAWKELAQANPVDDDRVGPAEVFGSANEHPPVGGRSDHRAAGRRPHHGGVVDAEQDHLLDHVDDLVVVPPSRRSGSIDGPRGDQIEHLGERVRWGLGTSLTIKLELLGRIGALLHHGRCENELGPAIALVERHGPLHPVNTPDPLEVALEHRLDVVHEPDAGIHDPQIRPRDVGDLAQVRSMRPQKIDPCWVISAAAKVNPMTMPRNLALSPTSIFKAIQYMDTPHDRESELCPSGVGSPASLSVGPRPSAARQNPVIWSVR